VFLSIATIGIEHCERPLNLVLFTLPKLLGPLQV
jgi:hypothetical protein